MIGKKLIRILQSLDASSFRRLGDAFASPFFTTSPLLLKLYALLKKEYPEFKTEKLNKEKIFKTLYPGKPFSDGALRVLVREFTKITEDFVLFEALKNDEFARQKALTTWYGAHDLYPEFEKSTQALLTRMEHETYRDVEYFREAAALHTAKFFHPSTPKHTLEDQPLTDLMDSVDRNYILLKMRLASEMKNRERILAKQYDVPMMTEVLTAGDTGAMKDNLSYQMYRLLLSLYKEGENHDNFFLLKTLLIKDIKQLRSFDQTMVLTQLINYAIQQLNRGKPDFNKDIFELYRLAVGQNLVLVNGKIEASVFQNIVSSGCRENELPWTTQFIEVYAPFLEKSIMQDCKTMSLALVCYHKKDYDRAIELITNHHFYDLLLQMNTRIMLVKVWFEKFLQNGAHYEHLLYQLDTNEKFTRRNNVISAAKKEENLNFFLATRLLANLFLEKKPASFIRSKLEKYTGPNQRTLSRDWLLYKMEAYDNKN